MSLHGAKRTRPAEEALLEDVDADLDQNLWPAVRERCAAIVRERLSNELSRVQEALESEYSARMSALQAKEEALEAAMNRVEDARAALEADREALEEERRRMAGGSCMEDVLTLNVGGEKTVAAQRSTLCAVEDSMLASLFSGRWDGSLTRDANGAVFVDFCPELFMPLLEYLRAKRVEDPAMPAVMPVMPGCEEQFQTMLRYYGLERVGQSPPAPLAFAFLPSSEGRTFELRDGGRSVTRTTGSHWKRAFGSVTLCRSEMQRPLSVSFRVLCFGDDPKSTDCPPGPHVGFAAAGLDRASDGSNERLPEGVWTFRAADGALLAPAEADVVGPSPRAVAAIGDLLTFALHRDGTVELAKNGESQGIVFRNLPDSVKPVVEMNMRRSRVCIAC